MKKGITSNQRDSGEALKWAALTAGFILVVSFLLLIIAETGLFSVLKIIDTDANFKQLFLIYITHATQLNILGLFHINNISLVYLNEIFKDNIIIKACEYIIYSISLIFATLSFKSEYDNNMINERFISGVRYYKGDEAVINLKKYIGDVEDNAVRIAGIKIKDDTLTKHLCILGKVGQGKTVALVPILRDAIARGDRVLLFDNKTDFSTFIVDENGNCPVIVAPWDARSACFDIARDCRTTAEAAELSKSFIGESGGDPMWGDGARAILTGFIHKLQVDKQENWGWQDLGDLIANTSMNDVEAIMEKYHTEGKRAVEAIKDANGQSEGAGKTTQSLLITLSAQLSPVYRMAEAWAGVQEKFSVRDFMDDKLKSKVVILQGNATLLGVQNAYISGILSTLAARVNSSFCPNISPNARGTWIFLDELPQLGPTPLPSVSALMAIGRSKGVRVIVGLQSPAQLRELMEKDGSDAMFEIFNTFIFCGLGGDSAAWASGLVGNQIIERYKPSSSSNQGQQGGSTSSSWERVTEPAIIPSDFLSGLGPDKKIGGIRALLWQGSDIYNLIFKFQPTPELRPGAVPALWTLPSWDRPTLEQLIKNHEAEAGIDIKEIEQKIIILTNNIADFLAATIEHKKTQNLTHDVVLFESLAVIANQDHTEAENLEVVSVENEEVEDNSGIIDNDDLQGNHESHKNQALSIALDIDDDELKIFD